MIELIPCQILPLVRYLIGICMVDHSHGLMNSQHVLLHGLAVFLPDLIQGPHSVIVMHVTEHMIHACQEFRDSEVPTFLQQMHPPAWVPLQTGVQVRHHALLLILVQLSLHIKPPQGICHIHIWICRLKDWHVQMRGGEVFLILPPPPAMSTAWCFTHHGVPI